MTTEQQDDMNSRVLSTDKLELFGRKGAPTNIDEAMKELAFTFRSDAPEYFSVGKMRNHLCALFIEQIGPRKSEPCIKSRHKNT